VTRALWSSVALHVAVLVLVGWGWTGHAGAVSRSVSVRLGPQVIERTVSPSVEPQRSVAALSLVASGEPTIDALTAGPAAGTPSLADYPSPGYPGEARRLGWEGVVEIEVEVSAEGRWLDGRLLRSSGHGPLDEAALVALRNARYRPASHNGVAEPGMLDALVRFRLK